MVAEAVSGRDIVQDNVADCSLVAALIIGAQHHAKFGSRVSFGRAFLGLLLTLSIASSESRVSIRRRTPDCHA